MVLELELHGTELFVVRKLIAQQQKMMEEQRKRMEKAIKEKQFQDQQKRLKEFTAIGGRKVDVDSFMKSIVGDEPKKPQPQPQSRPGGPTQPGHMASGAAQPAQGTFADPRGAPGTRPPGSNSFIFMQFLAKI